MNFWLAMYVAKACFSFDIWNQNLFCEKCFDKTKENKINFLETLKPSEKVNLFYTMIPVKSRLEILDATNALSVKEVLLFENQLSEEVLTERLLRGDQIIGKINSAQSKFTGMKFLMAFFCLFSFLCAALMSNFVFGLSLLVTFFTCLMVYITQVLEVVKVKNMIIRNECRVGGKIIGNQHNVSINLFAP